MTIGTMTLRLMMRQSRSLKDKRRVIHSLRDKIRRRFNVSIAEIDAQDNRQLAVLGFAIVSADRQFANPVLNKVVDFVRMSHRAELIDYEMEML